MDTIAWLGVLLGIIFAALSFQIGVIVGENREVARERNKERKDRALRLKQPERDIEPTGNFVSRFGRRAA